MTPIPHDCKPGTWCGSCAHNVQCGLEPNHPGNHLRPPRKGETPQCIHLGKAVRIPGASRVFRLCMANEAPQVGGISACVQCSSRTGNEYRIGIECGPKCKEYSAPVTASSYVPVAPDLGTPYPVPGYGSYKLGTPAMWKPTPPPTLPLTSRRAVVTVVVGENAERNHRYVRKSHEAYAKRHGADYIVLTGKTQDHGCFEKFRYQQVVEAYPDGTLCIDGADTWIHPSAPSIWDAASGKCAMVRADRHTKNPQLKHWGASQLSAVCRSQGVAVPAEAERTYFNSGVWVGWPQHAGYWQPPLKPTPGGWCDEENWCRVNMFSKGIPVVELDWRWNWTWCDDRSMSLIETETPYIVHLAGMDNQGVPADWRVPTAEMRRQMLLLMGLTNAE